MVKIINFIFKRFSKTKFWVWFAKHIVGKLTFRIMGYTQFPMEKYEGELLPALKKSDKEGKFIYAFTCSDTKCFAKYLITLVSGSRDTHAGLIYPDHKTLTHMKGKGITQNHILNTLKKNDEFAIVRFRLSDAEYAEYQRRVEKYIKIKAVYDFGQEIESGDDVRKLYCSELVWRAGKGLVDKEEFKPREELGRLIFEPDDVYKNGEIIFEHRL